MTVVSTASDFLQVIHQNALDKDGNYDPEFEAARKALRARVLAVAWGADVRIEESTLPGILGPRLFHRVWVGPPGGARSYGGDTLVEAAENAVRALTPDDSLPW